MSGMQSSNWAALAPLGDGMGLGALARTASAPAAAQVAVAAAHVATKKSPKAEE
jgi:hypothetical protein